MARKPKEEIEVTQQMITRTKQVVEEAIVSVEKMDFAAILEKFQAAEGDRGLTENALVETILIKGGYLKEAKETRDERTDFNYIVFLGIQDLIKTFAPDEADAED